MWNAMPTPLQCCPRLTREEKKHQENPIQYRKLSIGLVCELELFEMMALLDRHLPTNVPQNGKD